MACVALSSPEARGRAHANPPIELFQKADGFGGAEVAECIGVALEHDPRTHAFWHVDACGFIVEEASSSTARTIRGGGRRLGNLSNQERIAVIIGDDATFCGQFFYVGEGGPSAFWCVAKEALRQGRRLPKLNVANGGVARGVFLLFLMPVGVGEACNRVHEGDFCRRGQGSWQ